MGGRATVVDYQEMYYKMNRAIEKAINILVAVQRECEEDYLRQTEPPAATASMERWECAAVGDTNQSGSSQ